MLDPNPLVAGKGISWLKQAGIKVRLGLLEKEARRLNPGFIKRMAQGLPRLRAKMAMGLDGRSAMADGTSQWITGPAARADGQRLRAGSGAIVFGIGSVLQDNPQMNLRCDWAGLYTQQPELMLDRPVPQPLRVLLDSRLRLPLTAALLNNSAPLLIVTAQPDKDKQVQLAHQGIDVISLANTNGQVDLRPLLQLLAQRQINEVLLEAGPTLTGAFLAQGLVDELVVYWAPKLMGSKAKPAFELPLERLSQSIGLDIQEVRAVGADWRIKARPRLQEHS
jgi:diaminohydroxyphosphoribosylaminopyrimidine deaminase/5-amino-6-(5-phosphoribosylamino)uracil reductase